MSSENLRKIKSFVRREGRMTRAQQNAIEQLWPKYGLECKGGMLKLEEVFGRRSEVILEVGFGMGDSLLEMALQHPENDYIGVEVHRPGIGALLIQMQAAQATNIRLFQEDVNEVLTHCIPDEGLAGINIFFPDPWPKKRHHKRRLIQMSFIELLHQKLALGGRLHLATDWENYAEHMMEVLSAHDGFNNLAGHGNFIEQQALRPMTKFEKRGLKLGHGVWDLVFVKM